MKKHCEIDFIDGKIVHSVNRCIVYNNKHIEVARFKQPNRKLNLYEFNEKIRASIKSEQGKSSRENLTATVLNLIAKIKWRTLKVDFATLDPKNSFKTAKLSKISFDKKTGKNNKVPLKMCCKQLREIIKNIIFFLIFSAEYDIIFLKIREIAMNHLD